MNRKLYSALLIAFSTTAASFVATPAIAQSKGAAYATVNGKAIPQNRADALLAGQTAQGQPDTPELRQAVREELVRREILSQEAIKKGFDKKTEVLGQIDLARQGVMIGAYLNDFVRANPVTARLQGIAEVEMMKWIARRQGHCTPDATHRLIVLPELLRRQPGQIPGVGQSRSFRQRTFKGFESGFVGLALVVGQAVLQQTIDGGGWRGH